MFLVGKIVGTHGIKGEVKVINESDFDRFFVGSKLFVYKNNKYVPIVIDSVRYHKNFVLISFNKHTNINEILDYVNTSIYIDKHEDELEEDEYYYEELIGCLAYTQDNELIGDALSFTCQGEKETYRYVRIWRTYYCKQYISIQFIYR